jgi:pyruvate,water dikinase
MGRYVFLLSEIGLEDLNRVGGKGAHLGQMIRAGFPVPPGLSIQADAYERLLAEGDLKKRIARISDSIDFGDLEEVEEKTARIREIIASAQIPPDMAKEIGEAYEALGEREAEAPLVAVRSSVGTKDLSRSSFPGQMDTFHNVRGVEDVLRALRECWASVWSVRAAITLHALRIDPNMMIIAPVVQRMVPSEVSGVLFTANPIEGKAEEMLLEAAFGLGEAVVSGRLTPDHYVISKKGLRVVAKQIGCKSFKLELDLEEGRGNRRVELAEEEASRECLTSGQVRKLAELGIAVEELFGVPQDIEWAYSGGGLFLLQSRKIRGFRRVSESSAPVEGIS